MADTVYVVRTKYKTEGVEESGKQAQTAAPHFNKLGGAMEEARKSSGQLAEASGHLTAALNPLNGMLLKIGAAFGFAKIAEGIKHLTGSLIELNSASESTTIALAGMMQANGAFGTQGPEGFANAMGMSAELMRQMRKDARDLPGEFEDLLNIMHGALGGGIQAGKSVWDTEKLAADLMAVSATLKIPSEFAGREVMQLFEGRAGTHNTLWNRLKNQIGMTAEEFNNLTPDKKFDAIKKALVGYQGSIKKFGDTWDAVSSSSTDYIKALARAFGQPIFQAFKNGLSTLNDAFDKNREVITEIAHGLGTVVADGLKRSIGLAKELGAAMRSVWQGQTMGAMREAIGGLAGNVIGSIRDVARGIGNRIWTPYGGPISSSLDQIQSIGPGNGRFNSGGVAMAAAGAGALVGVPGLGLAVSGLINFATHLEAVQSVLISLGRIWNALLSVLDPVLRLFEVVGAYLGSMLAAVLPGLMGGLDEMISGIAAGLRGFIETLIPIAESLAKHLLPIFETVGDIMRNLGHMLSVNFQIWFKILGWVFSSLETPFNFLIDRLKDAAYWIKRFSDALVYIQNHTMLRFLPKSQAVESGGWDFSFLHNIKKSFDISVPKFLEMLKGKMPVAVKANVKQVNNVQMPVTINQADNPDRVFIDVKKALRDALLFPKESGVPLAAAIR